MKKKFFDLVSCPKYLRRLANKRNFLFPSAPTLPNLIFFKVFFISIVLGLFIFTTINAEEREVPKISVISIDGSVEANVFGLKWEPAFKGLKLYKQSKIRTGKNSYCDLDVYSKHTIKVQPSSEMSVANLYLTDENTESKKVNLNLAVTKGNVFSKIGKLAENEAFTVTTPTAVCGVRGTEFGADVSDKTTVEVLDGNVEVYNSEFPEQIQMVAPGQFLNIFKSIKPDLPVKMSRDQLEKVKSIAQKILVDKSKEILIKPEFVSFNFKENKSEKNAVFSVKVDNINVLKQTVYLLYYLEETKGAIPKLVGQYKMTPTISGNPLEKTRLFMATVPAEKKGQYSFRFSIENNE